MAEWLVTALIGGCQAVTERQGHHLKTPGWPHHAQQARYELSPLLTASNKTKKHVSYQW